MWFEAFLLSLQAAGMVFDYMGTKSQQELGDMGAKLQQAGIQANIQQTRLETEDASLQALKQLRQNLGTQAAVMAARGTRSGAGSALNLMTESVGNFQADERMRRLNLLGREAALKAGGSVYKLNQAATNQKLWQGFASRSFSKIPTSKAAWQGIGEGFGLTEV